MCGVVRYTWGQCLARIIPIVHWPVPSLGNNEWYGYSFANALASSPWIDNDLAGVPSSDTSPVCLPSIYLTSLHVAISPWPSPPYLHTASDQKTIGGPWNKASTSQDTTYMYAVNQECVHKPCARSWVYQLCDTPWYHAEEFAYLASTVAMAASLFASSKQTSMTNIAWPAIQPKPMSLTFFYQTGEAEHFRVR